MDLLIEFEWKELDDTKECVSHEKTENCILVLFLESHRNRPNRIHSDQSMLSAGHTPSSCPSIDPSNDRATAATVYYIHTGHGKKDRGLIEPVRADHVCLLIARSCYSQLFLCPQELKTA
ncbi:hypothetical protein CC77DRAFT_1072921 [Alternaria alternata]|uniref:Uncharacterized protein n=1 Tax=Alternaria alternata TaxID=5599 RepID=A0A177DHN3_ALTAL|nr:hypothetical protein CC77DRAFT_1072921 [Alternaria alternata]OAG18878.1 hypothetical protein CC77DRAFT_1072921 [Alternaria alternata]